jgi:integrator complex subunit 11
MQNFFQPFDRSYIDNPGAMVVFATPGMLHAGLSLQIFKRWASCDNNMVSTTGPQGHRLAGAVLD